MNEPIRDEQEKMTKAVGLLASLQNMKSEIIKKYRKKFEELKIRQINKSLNDDIK